MGAIASAKADRVIVTDDNPRSEDPAAIRAAILAAAPRRRRDRRPARGDPRRDSRAQGRRRAADRRQGPRNRPDRRRSGAAVQRSRGGRRGAQGAWPHERAGALDRRGDGGGDARRAAGRAARRRFRHFHRHPHDRRGRCVLRAQGRARRPRFRAGRACSESAGSRWWPRIAVPICRRMRRCWSCPTCSTRCAISRAPRARARTPRSSPSPARSARPAPRRRCGLALAKEARRMPRSRPTTIIGACRCRSRAARRARAYAVFEIGMNHAGEIAPLSRLVRPHVAIDHHDRAGASRILRLARRRSPTPRRKSSSASSPAAPP